MRTLFRLAVPCLLASTSVAAQPADMPGKPTAANKAAAVPRTPGPVLSAAQWRGRTEHDLAAFADALRANYIYAAYPAPASWSNWFRRTLAQVESELPLVRDEAGYQAVLRHLAVAFHDAHVSVRFGSSGEIPSNWPGFLARLDNSAYRVTASRRPGLTDGAEVTACDGKPISWWISSVAEREVGLPVTLETTRNTSALRLFLDRGSPLRPRPTRCMIGGQPVALDWAPAPMKEINPIILGWRGFRNPEVSTRLIGTDGAWVKLGYFDASDADRAKALHAAIEMAPTLRNKRFIVLDVRGNGGGPYNWFMAYLRGLYGQAYADHYATARLRIRPVYRLSPAYIALDREDAAVASDFGQPADPPNETNEAGNKRLQDQAIAAGKPLFRALPIPMLKSDAAPKNPVRAQVFVLTNYACASACIGFVDELKQFPGVRQIGLPTAVDSRSGTAVEVELPSKKATVMIAAMTRDGRLRDENVPQDPSIRFDGDIRDDQAVETWFSQTVLARQPPLPR